MGFDSRPTVFVSSTCYDLKQIRNDLKHFVEDELGYAALLSESDSFPVDPTISIFENCVRNVDERADLFVLIIGGRYGFVTDSGQSVTNIEYLHARQKNIPIYVYIDKSILSNIPLWKENPNGSFKSIVDTPKLFEFVESIRSTENVWTFGYENANDIIVSLRSQFAYLFSNSLRIRSLLSKTKIPKNIQALTGDALNIIVTKPIAWEFRLLTTILSDGIDDSINLRRDYDFGISPSQVHSMSSFEELNKFIQCKTTQLTNSVSNLSILVDQVWAAALGEPGIEGNADLIVYVANSVIMIYRSLFDWAVSFKEIIAEPKQDRIAKSLVKAIKPTIEDIEMFVESCKTSVANLPSTIPPVDQPMIFTNVLKLRSPDLEEFNKAISSILED